MSADTDPSLAAAARRLRSTPLLDLFGADPARAGRLAFEWNGWHVDLAKERVDAPTLAALVQHARSIDLEHWIAALFAGDNHIVYEFRHVQHDYHLPADRGHLII
jgi:glucose-6-phosphate isomerase